MCSGTTLSRRRRKRKCILLVRTEGGDWFHPCNQGRVRVGKLPRTAALGIQALGYLLKGTSNHLASLLLAVCNLECGAWTHDPRLQEAFSPQIRLGCSWKHLPLCSRALQYNPKIFPSTSPATSSFSNPSGRKEIELQTQNSNDQCEAPTNDSYQEKETFPTQMGLQPRYPWLRRSMPYPLLSGFSFVLFFLTATLGPRLATGAAGSCVSIHISLTAVSFLLAGPWEKSKSMHFVKFRN